MTNRASIVSCISSKLCKTSAQRIIILQYQVLLCAEARFCLFINGDEESLPLSMNVISSYYCSFPIEGSHASEVYEDRPMTGLYLDLLIKKALVTRY